MNTNQFVSRNSHIDRDTRDSVLKYETMAAAWGKLPSHDLITLALLPGVLSRYALRQFAISIVRRVGDVSAGTIVHRAVLTTKWFSEGSIPENLFAKYSEAMKRHIRESITRYWTRELAIALLDTNSIRAAMSVSDLAFSWSISTKEERYTTEYNRQAKWLRMFTKPKFE